MKFLATIPDTFSEIDTATYIAQNYPWQAAAWFWTSVEAKTVSKTEELSINEYIEQYGGSLGVYLIIQYAVNSWSGSPSNDILTDIRDGKTSWDAENGRIFVNGTDVGKTPVGWDDVENNYNRENTYYEAIKCFQ